MKFTTTTEPTMEQLTELNSLFTYKERCQMAAERFIEQNPKASLESRKFKNSKNFWAGLIANSFQVEMFDMLEAAAAKQNK